MKDYTDFMNNISVDTELHEKIMERSTQKAMPFYHKRFIFRYTGIAACIVVLLFYMISGLINKPVENIQEDSIASIIPMASDEPVNIEIYPLTFNIAEEILMVDHQFPFNFFHYSLTDEQLNAIFHNINLTLAASAFYQDDGSLMSIRAVETLVSGRMDSPAMYSRFYTRTEILIGKDEIIDDCIISFARSPKVSNVYDIPVTASIFDGNNDVLFFVADFQIDNIAYRINLHDNKSDGQNRLTEIVNSIIRNGVADLSILDNPVIPEIRFDSLTIDEARLDPDFGAFLPLTIPEGFLFESAYRSINQTENNLSVHWSKSYHYIDWGVSEPTDYDLEHIISTNEKEKYDMALYSIPLADSVPPELMEFVYNPIFQAEEITLDIIRSRAYQINDRGDEPGWRMKFSVLYYDALVDITVKGVSPEDVWEMLSYK